MRLRFDLEQGTFRAGDPVRGSVVVESGGRSRRATIELRFVERSLPFEHVAHRTGPVGLTDEELATGAVLPFALDLPEDALPTVHTEHGSLLWELRVEVDVPMLPDVDERLELVVAP